MSNKVKELMTEMEGIVTYVKASQMSYYALCNEVTKRFETLMKFAQENNIPFKYDVEEFINTYRYDLVEEMEEEEDSSSFYEEESSYYDEDED